MTAHVAARPQPVLARASVVSVLHALSALVVYLGAPSAGGWIDGNRGLIAGVVLFLAPYVAALVTRGVVTPLKDPRNDAGQKLEPASTSVAVDATITAALAKAAVALEELDSTP